ncbi:MAG: type II secretion system F family protein [Phycisphaerales bacterium JB063]
MSQFSYEARDAEGELISGLIDATSVEQAGKKLAERSLFVIRLAEDQIAPKRASRKGGSPGASREQVAWVITQLSIMLKTGIVLSDALECLTRQISEPKLRRVLESMTRSVMEGQPLSRAMAEQPRTFPPSLVSLIRASEVSGTMSTVMHRTADYLIAERRAVRKARGALLYPAFMLLLCLSVSVFMLAVILPKFATIFASRQATLPLPTRILMAMSDGLIEHWLAWVLGVVIAAVAGWSIWRSAWGIRMCDGLVLQSPVLGKLFRSLYLSRSFRTLDVLVNAGVPLSETTTILREAIPNSHFKKLWQDVGDRILHGESIATPILESPLVPEQVGQMVACGDRSGKLGMVSKHLADHLEDEFREAVKTATQFIEPCMILVMGLLIGFIAASIMLPLFKTSALVAG